MFYRESGEFKTSYQKDHATFPIGFDRIRFWVIVALAALAIPFLVTNYWVESIFLPFFVYSIAAIGLNILVGYCGQVSLGTGGFMAVGAYACFKFMAGLDIWYPTCNGSFALSCEGGVEYELLVQLAPMHIVPAVLMAGLTTALVGILFGLPSLRIKGFYLAVATLASQFFLVWLFNTWSWTYNDSDTGQITAVSTALWCFSDGAPVGAGQSFADTLACPQITGAGKAPWVAYLFGLAILFVFAWIATNLVRGRIGRSWMAIRDMDIAADIIGVNPLKAKLSAFAVSSFYIGMAGALYLAVWKGAADATEAFPINISFNVLFMVIIGGLGSIFGSMVGAAFLALMPVLFKNVLVGTFGWPADIAAHFETILLGSLIIVFLILEPHGIAALWRTMKEKLRLWPFPH